jgi:3-oxoacyl-[acyl-carrier protein] reductase
VPPTDSRRAVAIVTGGAFRTGRDIARELASWAWPVVVVYLAHQSEAKTTIAEIIAAEGTTVAVRADLADDLDVQRLFDESITAFGGVDVVVHTTRDSPAVLYLHAARNLRRSGAIVSTSGGVRLTPDVARQLRERGITVDKPPPEAVLSFLDRWRQGIL